MSADRPVQVRLRWFCIGFLSSSEFDGTARRLMLRSLSSSERNPHSSIRPMARMSRMDERYG